MCKKRIKNAAAAHARFRFGERTGTAKRKEKERKQNETRKKTAEHYAGDAYRGLGLRAYRLH